MKACLNFDFLYNELCKELKGMAGACTKAYKQISGANINNQCDVPNQIVECIKQKISEIDIDNIFNAINHIIVYITPEIMSIVIVIAVHSLICSGLSSNYKKARMYLKRFVVITFEASLIIIVPNLISHIHFIL